MESVRAHKSTLIWVANRASSPRVERVVENGREYYVAPLTLIVPGVLNGSQGALYYPPEEIARNVSDWNGMPLVLGHPTRMGYNVSFGDLDDKERSKTILGEVRNAHTNPHGSLKAQGWFDIENVRRISPQILNSLENHRPIELSTGLFTDNKEAPKGSVFNGRNGPREYEYTAHNYRPDHLAILPNQVGACSVNDGCGVLVNSERFHLPENYDKIKDLPNGKQLWAGANDWESGWSYAWIQDKKSPDNGHSRVDTSPTSFIEIDHSKCPGCHGNNSNDEDGPANREEELACQAYAKSQVAKWAKTVIVNANPEGCNQHTSPGCGHGLSDSHIDSMSPVRRQMLASRLGIKVKGKSDKEITTLLKSDRESTPTQSPTIQPSASTKTEALKELMAAKQKGEDKGGLDPRGDLQHLPDKSTLQSLHNGIKNIVEDHVKRTSVGMRVEDLHDALGGSSKVSSEQFRATLIDAHSKGTVRMSGYPKMLEDHPRPNLMPTVSSMVMGYVGKGTTSNSNPEGHNQYTGSAGISKGFHNAISMSKEDHEQVHSSIDSASKGELHEAIKGMGFRTDQSWSHGKLKEQAKRFIDDRRGAFHKNASIEQRAKDKWGKKSTTNEEITMNKQGILTRFFEWLTAPVGSVANVEVVDTPIITTTNAERCPECGGQMEDGECEKCGYEEDTRNTAECNCAQCQSTRNASVPNKHPDSGKFIPHGIGHGNGPVHDSAIAGYKGEEETPTPAIETTDDTDSDSDINLDTPDKEEEDGDSSKKLKGDKVTTTNASQPGHLEGADRAQVQAAMAAMASDQGSSRAKGASATAKERGSGRAHKAAASAHSAAAAGHREQASHHEAMGNTDKAESHTGAAKYHEKKALFHKGKASGTNNMTREQLLSSLTANCTCEKEKVALNMLTDKTLYTIYNAKLDGSNLDTGGNGSESIKVGGDRSDEDDEFTDEDEVDATRGEKKLNMNQWMAAMPPEAQAVWNAAANIEKQGRLSLVRRLVSNVQDPTRRQSLGEALMKKSLPELQMMADLIPQQMTQNQYSEPEMQPNFAGAGNYAPNGVVSNQSSGSDDILDLPVMNWKETG